MTGWQLLAIIAIIFIVILCLPLVLITGLNYMGLNIPYTLDTWMGAAFVLVAIRSTGGYKSGS